MTLLEIQGVLITIFGTIFGVLCTVMLVMCLVGIWKSMRNAFK